MKLVALELSNNSTMLMLKVEGSAQELDELMKRAVNSTILNGGALAAASTPKPAATAPVAAAPQKAPTPPAAAPAKPAATAPVAAKPAAPAPAPKAPALPPKPAVPAVTAPDDEDEAPDAAPEVIADGDVADVPPEYLAFGRIREVLEALRTGGLTKEQARVWCLTYVNVVPALTKYASVIADRFERACTLIAYN